MAAAQQVNSQQFSTDLLALINDAKTGFSKATGDLQEENRYEKIYKARMSVFNQTDDAKLNYQVPQNNTYTASVPERFWFFQSFTDSKAASTRFMLDSAEYIFDEIAKSAKLKKEKRKMSKEDRDFKAFDYMGNGKTVFRLTVNPVTEVASFRIYSPRRPGDVFIPNLLGSVAVFYSNMNSMTVVEVYGEKFTSKEAFIEAVRQQNGYTDSYYKFEWHPGASYKSLNAAYGKQMNVQQAHNSYSMY